MKLIKHNLFNLLNHNMYEESCMKKHPAPLKKSHTLEK